MLLDSIKRSLVSYRADMELRLLILECSHPLSLFMGNKGEWGPLFDPGQCNEVQENIL